MAQQENAFEAYAQTGKAMFDYWVSFFPTAPFFGVEWRYGEFVMPDMTSTDMTSTDVTEDVAETVDLAEPATADAEEVVEAVAEAPVEAVAEPEETVEEPAAEASAEEVSAEEASVAEEDVEDASAATPMLYSEAPAEIDDLTAIKGVGPGLETQLHNLGIYKFEQLASFDDAQMEWLDANLKAIKGRCIRDDWAGQAKAFLD